MSKKKQHKTMKEFMRNFIFAICMIFAFIGLFTVIVISISEQEEAECRRWVNQSIELERYNPKTKTGYYILPWQKEQCDAHNIKVEAYVLTGEYESE